MPEFDAQAHALSRFREKCRLAGGPKAGYNLRRQSIQYGLADDQLKASDEGIAALVDAGILVANEQQDRLILTEEGVPALAT